MTGRLQNKKAIIVGAGQMPGDTLGNGSAIAQRFGEEGATVFCVDREQDRVDSVVDAIRRKGGDAIGFVADVADGAACSRLITAGAEALGRVDILVNNVGIGGHLDGPADKLEEDKFDLILNVNLRSHWLTSKAVIPIMRAQGDGVIINISSIAAFSGSNQAAYEMSKAGVNRLTKSVARANAAYGIRANAIMPGVLDTPMVIVPMSIGLGKPPEEIRAGRDAQVPLRGKQGSAQDTANAALFLASDEASFITGAVLPVDGGALTRRG